MYVCMSENIGFDVVALIALFKENTEDSRALTELGALCCILVQDSSTVGTERRHFQVEGKGTRWVS